ncbi:MAG: NAD-dependent epimerase/dehydratase family protein [Flavobacteriaceae bacterium]
MKILIIGASGMVGQAVLKECLEHSAVEEVTTLSRAPLNLEHAKLKAIILEDFQQFNTLSEDWSRLDACFYCMGISSVGVDTAVYQKITVDITVTIADELYQKQPNMVFTYVSGQGTDSSEKGRVQWARIKGKAENYILSRGFKDAYMFRPGVILPQKGIRSRTAWYNAVYMLMRPFFPLLLRSKNISTTTTLGLAMIRCVQRPLENKHLENAQINALAAEVEV